jgi:hypothetical protein
VLGSAVHQAVTFVRGESPTTSSSAPNFSVVYDAASAPFRFAHREFDSILTKLLSLRDEYSRKLDDIIAPFRDVLTARSEIETRFSSAYERYRKAGDDLKAADPTSHNFADLKTAFVNSQDQAIQLHTNFNELTLQAGVTIESSLSGFEECEQWRVDRVKEVFRVFATWCDAFARQIDDSQTTIGHLKRLVPQSNAIAEIFDLGDCQYDSFQTVPIDPRATHYIDQSVMFVDEQKKGCPLFRVKTALHGEGGFLPVLQGEVVCQVEERPEYIVAVTINGGRGRVPRNALELFRPQ